jgi:molybdopterin-guanine dinucleotide biosynthesis protein A
MGTDKATLRLDGDTLAQRAAARLTAVCSVVVEVGPGLTGRPHVVEEPAGSGPLAALAAGGAALDGLGWQGPALLLAVDLPRVGVALLELLRDWPGADTAVPEAGRLQPVCARYGSDAVLAASSLLAGGIRALQALFDVIEYDVVPEHTWRAVAPDDAFADVDTPDDAARMGIDLPRLP